jgi:hypothetical protein
MLETTPEGLIFALWYLKQRNLVASDDKSNLLITVEGMDYLETNPPTPDMVMPMFRAIGLASPKVEPAAAPNAAPNGAPAEAAPAPAAELTATGALNLKRIREALAR